MDNDAFYHYSVDSDLRFSPESATQDVSCSESCVVEFRCVIGIG